MSNAARMVFYARSAQSLQSLLQALNPSGCAIWIDADLIDREELAELRSLGWDITVWTNPRTTEHVPQLDAQWTMRMHHPASTLWIEDCTPAE